MMPFSQRNFSLKFQFRYSFPALNLLYAQRIKHLIYLVHCDLMRNVKALALVSIAVTAQRWTDGPHQQLLEEY